MKNQIKRGYFCPRWLHQNGIIVPDTYEEAMAYPSILANETMYRMRLVSLSFTGDVVVESEPDAIPPHAAWANQVLADIGKSGCSDMNEVIGSISTLCATPVSKRYKTISFTQGNALIWPAMDVRFPHPTCIPRDCGLEVKLAHRGNRDSTHSGLVTFAARGYAESGRHVVLAGEAADIDVNNSDVIIDSADLINNGKEDAYLTRMMLTYKVTAMADQALFNMFITQLGLIVNPTHGTAWMPGDEAIPLGNVMPMSTVVPDFYDGSARVYLFPDGVYLDPEQHLSVRLYQQTLSTLPLPNKINVCLFGELEVE